MVLHRTMLWIFGAAMAVSFATIAWSQGRPADKLKVTLPDRVHVGGQVLNSGDYAFEQLHSSGGAQQVVLVSQKDSRKYQASAISIPALRNVTPQDTQVVLQSFPAHWDPKLRIPRGQVVAAASIVSPKY